MPHTERPILAYQSPVHPPARRFPWGQCSLVLAAAAVATPMLELKFPVPHSFQDRFLLVAAISAMLAMTCGLRAILSQAHVSRGGRVCGAIGFCLGLGAFFAMPMFLCA